MSDAPHAPRRAVAIIGMSGRFPGAPTIRQFWQNLRNGVESLESFSDVELLAAGVDASTRALPGWVPRGTVLQDADLFDAGFFGYSPREAQIIDPQQRVFLECAWAALEDAGYAGEPSGATVGIYAGSSLNSYVLSQLLPNRELLVSVGGYQVMLGNDKDFLTTRASYKLDLHGPSMAIQTACSTSLVAVQVACQALFRGECDMALAGGVSITFPQRTGYQYQEGMIFSPDGVCRPFDADAKGTRVGSGAGIVVLKRLEDAIADRDTIQAVILGAAINNDGAAKAGYTAPSVDGQIEAIATAQALAGVSPDSISYIEAHGTATPLGDPIEITALTRVFRESTEARGFCAIGSLKANLGHLDAAAGVAGLIKTVLALRHRELPPQLNFRAPNPQLDLERSPFRVATSLEAWPDGATPRRAGVSSFGIGGTNAHVVLEEAPAPAPSVAVRDEQLLVVSAKTAQGLEAATSNLVSYLNQPDAAPLADVAYTLQIGRRVFSHRRSVVARNSADAVALLMVPDRSPVITGFHDGADRPVAFLFSGQGSQHAGMCADLYRTEAVFRAAIDRCAELLQPHFGRDVRELLWHGTDGELSETHVAQSALFVTEYALAVLWMSWGVQPSAMLGHSIGEYVAAHLAGVFSLEDALILVAARGRLMQGMASGDMLAVRLAPTELRSRLPAGVEIAAVNAPALCSVSGSREAIEALTLELERDGIEHRPLHTSHAFHSYMMEPALAPFREIVSRLQLSAPRRPIVSNVSGTWLAAAEATSPDYWTAHLRNAVLFADGIATLTADPSVQLLEVGPGNALTALARLSLGREGASRVSASMPHPREDRSESDTMLSAAGRLWASGVGLDWAGMHASETLHRVPLPTYPFERTRHWVEAPTAAASQTTAGSLVARRDDVGEWFCVPNWTSAPLARTRQAVLKGTWLLFGRADLLETAVRDALLACGVSVVTVRPGVGFAKTGASSYEVDAASSDDHEALLRAMKRDGELPRGALHLWNVGPALEIGDDEFALHSLLAFGRALVLEAPVAPLRFVVATSGVHRVLGEQVTQPLRALSSGPVLVMAQEHEALQVSALDLDVTDRSDWQLAAAAALLGEAAIDDADQLVAIRGGQRWARRFDGTTLPPTQLRDLPLRPHGVYLITGGLGGIGVTFALWLARTVSARLALTSRQALPPRDGWDAWVADHDVEDGTRRRIESIREIEAAGGEVMVLVADATDVESLRADLADVTSRWGEINGVVHAAGVATDALMALYTRDGASKTVAAKVGGTAALIEVLGETALDFALLCSSINAVMGFAGAASYAAGNAYLDAIVQSTRIPQHWNAISIGWDVWRDVGMATQERQQSAARAAQVAAGIRPADGVDAFGRAFASGLKHCVVSPYDVATALRVRSRTRSATSGSAAGAPVVARPSVPTARSSASVMTEPIGEIEGRLVEVWEDLLGVSPIGVHDNFFEMGGHSLMATRVIARVQGFFGVRLPLRELFNAPTIRQLGDLIISQQASATVPSNEAPAGDREEFEL